MSFSERDSLCAVIRRSFGFAPAFASVALLAGCSVANVAPAPATVTLPAAMPAGATVAVAVGPARPRPCRSNDECATSDTGGLCMPAATTKDLSDAEELLARAMTLQSLIAGQSASSSAARLKAILQQVQDDMSTYGRQAQGEVPQGDAPATNAQMQHAAWLQSGATQAKWIIGEFSHRLAHSPVTADAQKVYADIMGDSAGLHLDAVVGDLRTFLRDIEAASADVERLVDLRMPDGSAPTLESGAGAVARYVGPLFGTIRDDMSRVNAFLDPSAAPQLTTNLTTLSQSVSLVGKDGHPGTCVELP